MSAPIVRVAGLHKSFGSLEVLKGVDMQINAGEVIVVFGRSGSGKSTFARKHFLPSEVHQFSRGANAGHD